MIKQALFAARCFFHKGFYATALPIGMRVGLACSLF